MWAGSERRRVQGAAGVSQHLTALRVADMVGAHRGGRSVLYARIAQPNPSSQPERPRLSVIQPDVIAVISVVVVFNPPRFALRSRRERLKSTANAGVRCVFASEVFDW